MTERRGVSGAGMPYEDEGGGAPVVLLHGRSTSSEVWRPIVAALAERMRVIVPDLADPAETSLDPGHRAGPVRELLDGLGIDRFAAVGHAEGADIALRLALEGGVAALGLLDAMDVEDLGESELAALDVPAMVIWGEDDTVVPPEIGERLADRLPRASLVLLPGCSHLVLQDAPEAVASLLAEFLRAMYLGLPHGPHATGPVPITLERRGPA